MEQEKNHTVKFMLFQRLDESKKKRDNQKLATQVEHTCGKGERKDR